MRLVDQPFSLAVVEWLSFEENAEFCAMVAPLFLSSGL
jgi:hypothetical protein